MIKNCERCGQSIDTDIFDLCTECHKEIYDINHTFELENRRIIITIDYVKEIDR